MRQIIVSTLTGAAFALAAVAPVAAQTSGFGDTLMTSFGLLPPEAPEIEYRERAPLVVPPTADVLPSPIEASPAATDPAWPKDPDEARRKKAVEDSKKPNFVNDKQATRALKPSQLQGGRTVASSSDPGRATGGNKAAREDWMKPSALSFPGWGSPNQKPMVFEGEPEREALIQPPPGYQTPAANAPYGVVSEKKKEWSLPNWFDRTQKNNDRN
ncbi:MAG TPA: hypothetical protein VLA00_13525 [Xanthobacteraceae bacterium]|nr:hypothetical protein [Xanthobacteraceae bacterium]